MIRVLLLAAALLPAAAGAARADDVGDLKRDLEQRQKELDDLRHRIDALEAGKPAQAQSPAQEQAQAPAPAKPTADTRKDDRAVEEDLALQALSRTLVARGALLLPEWGLEVAPGVDYSHSQTDGTIIAQGAGGSLVTNQRLKRDDVLASVTTRLGLPWDSQVSLRIPYDFRRHEAALGTGFNGTTHHNDVGDVEFEVARQLLREDGWQPDLLAAVTTRFPTGGDPYDDQASPLATGTGVWGVEGRLTAVKSQDPLVFYGTLSYTANLSAHKGIGNVDPGDTVGVEVGTILAVSPRTSLTFSLTQNFTGKTSLNGTSLAGTDQNISTLNLGASTVLDKNILLDLTFAIGLTSDTPDYQVLLSLPIRFNL